MMTAPFYYLATPYSKYPAGLDAAYRDAATAAAVCFRSGILVFSPIAHTHVISKVGNLSGGFERWAALDEAMIAASAGMIVVEMDGWQESVGITAEIEMCRRLGKSVHYMRPDGPVPQVRIA
jgi:hypothetical protein